MRWSSVSSSTSSPPSSLFLPTTTLLRRCNGHLSLESKTPTLLRLSCLSTSSSAVAATDGLDDDDYNGWAIVEAPSLATNKKLVIAGSAAAAALLAALAYFSLSEKGFRLQLPSPFIRLRGMVSTIGIKVDEHDSEDEDASFGGVDENVVASEVAPAIISDAKASMEKHESVKISIPVDSTQLEALSVLKKLKIIEDDIRADELCTRREYARWLVRLNSSLERNPKHRIVQSILLTGSMISAFDDMAIEDPDFESVQALAEAGITPSKLSGSSKGVECTFFYPKRFICRQDLINWKAQLEYGFMSRITEQMSTTKQGYMDLKEVSSDASPELFIDLFAENKSIIRNVFGQSRRFQPNKPSTKGQAAVALTSGRMKRAVNDEILRLEAQNALKQAAIEEIRSELLERGDIQRFWDEKMKEERNHGSEVEKHYFITLSDLEREKIVQEKTSAEYLKEKSAMDCQRQLLLNLKEEVDEMSEKRASERATYETEQSNVHELLSELRTRQEQMLDTKSELEAEVKALQFLRSLVEDEARKNQARAKVLEEVGQRWRWHNRA